MFPQWLHCLTIHFLECIFTVKWYMTIFHNPQQHHNTLESPFSPLRLQSLLPWTPGNLYSTQFSVSFLFHLIYPINLVSFSQRFSFLLCGSLSWLSIKVTNVNIKDISSEGVEGCEPWGAKGKFSPVGEEEGLGCPRVKSPVLGAQWRSLATALGGCCYYPHFTDVEIKAHRG